MSTRTWIARLLAGAAVTAAVGSSARAGLLPADAPTVTPEAGGDYRWTYAVVLPTSTQLRSGDYFTIYDFGGYVPGTASQPADWTVTMSKVGPTPARLNPDDDPALPNLTWTYHGPTVTGQVGLGNFWAESTMNKSEDSFFTATSGASTGKLDSNITSTSVPKGSTATAPVGTPEPATLALAGLGLPLLGLARLARRKAA